MTTKRKLSRAKGKSFSTAEANQDNTTNKANQANTITSVLENINHTNKLQIDRFNIQSLQCRGLCVQPKNTT